MIYSSLTERLKNQHKTIASIIIKLSNERLEYRPAPGKWNIHENIAHLSRYQIIFISRIRKILIIDEPSFTVYKAEDDKDFAIYKALTIYELLKKISAEREEIFHLISNLPADKLDRIGIHPKFGKLTISDWCEFFLLHEAHHLFTIFQLAHSTKQR